MENRQNKPPEGGAASGHGGQKFHTDSEQAKLHKSKLRMESREERLNKARERLANQKPPKKPGPIKRIARIAGHETHAFLHGKVYQEERDNVGVESGHFVERSGEAALHYGRHKVRRAIREHPAKAAARAESRYIKATADYHSRKFAQEQPEAQSAAARLWHRHKLKREYQRKARETAKQTAKAAEQTVSATERLVREAAAFVKRHPVGTLLALGCLLVVLTLQSCMSSMVSVGNSTLAAIAASTYKAEDADMLGAEAAYCALEDELQRYLDTYTRTHDYDEYHFDLDTIEHDPYVLISMISALHEGAWTLDEVRGTLQDLFDRQYILTEDVVVEVRYRTVTRTDSEGNDYEVEVPYNYYICYVTLENFNLSHVPVYMMSEEQLSMYALYMSTLGNRLDLFPSSGYIGKYITSRPPEHEVPESYLDDETFAAILKEAEKYLGFPYVWGGSSPSTSFDCSGFVSWVLTNSGVCNTGRLGAQGLYNISTPVSNPQPGDLVFFVGTYDTPGVSHVGIYVGNSMMIHCGDVERGDSYIREIADCPVVMVAGNNDYYLDLPSEEEVRIGDYKVLVTHGHGYYVNSGVDYLREHALEYGYDVVMYGHTHVPYIEIGDDVTILNPGSISYPRQPGRKPTFLIMEIDEEGQAHYAHGYYKEQFDELML